MKKEKTKKMNRAILMIEGPEGMTASEFVNLEMTSPGSLFQREILFRGTLDKITFIDNDYWTGDLLESIFLQHKIAIKELMLNLKKQGK